MEEQEEVKDQVPESASQWLPTAVLWDGVCVDQATELAVVLAKAHDMAAGDHVKLRFKMMLIGLPILLLSFVPLALAFVSIGLEMGIAGFAILFILGTSLLLFGTVIHKPLTVESLRKVYWTTYLLPYQSVLLFDADGIADKTEMEYDEIPLGKIRDMATDMPGAPDSLEVETEFRQALTTIQALSETREQVRFQTDALVGDSPFVEAVRSVIESLESVEDNSELISDNALTMVDVIAQRDRIHALETARYVINTLREVTETLDQKASEFISNLDQSVGRVEQYLAWVGKSLSDRWFGGAQIIEEPTFLSTMAADRKRGKSKLSEFDYELGSHRVVVGDQPLPRSSVLTTLNLIFANLEDKVEGAVEKIAEHAERGVRDKENQATNNVRMTQDTYSRSIRDAEANSERAREEAARASRKHTDAVNRTSQATSRAESERKSQDPNQASYDLFVAEAQRALSEAQEALEDHQARMRDAERYEADAEAQRQEMEGRINQIQEDLETDLDEHRDSVRSEIKVDRRHVDPFYALRDGQLQKLLRVLGPTLENERRVQCEPFQSRRDIIHDTKIEITSGLNSRIEERKVVLDQIAEFKLSDEKHLSTKSLDVEMPTTISIPFWVGELQAKDERDTFVFPPSNVTGLSEPPKSSRNYEAFTSAMSSSLEVGPVPGRITEAVAGNGSLHQVAVSLPLQGSMGTRVGEALDDLAAKEMIAGGYSKRVKKFFGVQDAVS